MKLSNGAEPIQWTARLGEAAEMAYVGKVIARLVHNDYHPFVVWMMSSNDAVVWDCVQGNYCENYYEAEMIYEQCKV